MEMHERIKELRKDHLHLSQTDFGSKLGVSRSVINNIERNVLARPEQKLSLVKLICKEFSVNEEWLLNGTEPMIKKPDTFSLDDFVKQRNATDIDLQIVKTYFDLPPDVRSLLVERFRSVFTTDNTTATESDPPKLEKSFEEMSAEEIAAQVVRDREMEKAEEKSSRFSSTA